ncbi:hypothetical protein HW115_08175 [Verrucomicrobiaceae bacterium N1E253]|uniref:DUF4405 domain-containing protein n=1 Tax=Oceaniferula marina TaxID=2748318 RepID=A0A851GK86_9BACT|nr:hypothetical protein [Oceaniferula marina]NWK55585.1 hypothetical protein [Oceaniferula marina]
MKRFFYSSMTISFLVLIVTGGLRFLIPFNLNLSRLHIVSGIILSLLVLIHLAGKAKTLRRIIAPKHGRKAWLASALTLALCIGVGLAAWFGTPGVSHLMGLSYESRNHASIFRAQDNVASDHQSRWLRTSKLTSTGASIDIELLWNCPAEHHAVAIWAETQSGTIIETLYLSGSLSFSDEHPWESKRQRRGQILPIWRHRYTSVCGIAPTGATDLISQPTINHQWLLDHHLNKTSKPFTLFVEINIAGDKHSSLIYASRIDPESPNAYTLLNLIGHSHGSLKDGEINYEISQLPARINQVERILVKTIWK